MSDYKRLTNKNTDEFNPEYDFCIGCKYFGEPNGCNRRGGSCDNYERFIETYNRLAELEDKIENGMLVELPCSVRDIIDLPCNIGDHVFVIYGYEIQHTSVYSMKVELEDYHFVFILNCMVTQGGARFDKFIFGKTAFLTREEANKALEERRKEDKNNG